MYNSGTSFADIEMPDNDIFGASTNNGDKVSSGVIIPYKIGLKMRIIFPFCLFFITFTITLRFPGIFPIFAW